MSREHIAENEIHLWLVDLEISEQRSLALSSLLSPYEQSRAARFVFPRDRLRFIAARGHLREILSRYDSVSADRITFVANSYGKPFLNGGSRLQFNLSHSESLALIGITLDRAIGVDIEAAKPELASDDVAKQCFSAREFESLSSVPEADRCREFFTIWTLKEAYIKALGMGLSYELDAFDVSTTAENALLLDTNDVAAPDKWTLHPLQTVAHFSAALAYEGKHAKLCYRTILQSSSSCAKHFTAVA